MQGLHNITFGEADSLTPAALVSLLKSDILRSPLKQIQIVLRMFDDCFFFFSCFCGRSSGLKIESEVFESLIRHKIKY